jgi:protocatechuate 3,4-dioxygenase beta subunit
MSAEDSREHAQRIADRSMETHADDVPLDCSGMLTAAVEEGPFYKAGSPERTNIVGAGTVGDKLIVEGYVFNRNCLPIAGAWVDFWQSDGNGVYDNAGYNLRGHQYADEFGRYHLETVRPVEYGPRTAHLHVKVKARDDSPAFTTQLFLPGERRNQADSIFDSSLVMNIIDTEDGEKATFNFVLDID